MSSITGKLHQINILGMIFHSLDYCLQESLKDCESVLDLGCGPSSPLKNCKNIKHSVGVEAFKPYLEKSKKAGIHSEYLAKKINEVDFAPNSFDAVILIEVIEHLPDKEGLDILKKAEKWAKKKVIVSSPNGFLSQKELDDNPYQKHLSGWGYERMKKLGFKSYGLAGPKYLRREIESDTMTGEDLTASMRFRPRLFWFTIACLAQILLYWFPWDSFELFSIKRKDYE